MSEQNLKPSVVTKVSTAVSTIMNQMLKMGLKERDFILLIQDRTSNKVNRTDIKAVLDAIKLIEKQFLKAQEES
jgi:pseudouridine-5'-phosphate glycosidase